LDRTTAAGVISTYRDQVTLTDEGTFTIEWWHTQIDLSEFGEIGSPDDPRQMS
jgi:hypothetical protein